MELALQSINAYERQMAFWNESLAAATNRRTARLVRTQPLQIVLKKKYELIPNPHNDF